MVFVNIMWGLSFMFSKNAMSDGFSPMTLAFVRYAIAVCVLVPITLLKEKTLGIQKKDIPLLFLSGLLGITFYYYFEYTGMLYTSTVNASLIIASIPILTMFVQAIVFRSPLTTRKAVGAFLSLSGVGLIVLFSDFEGIQTIKGDLLIIGACIVWIGYIFVSKKLRDAYSSLQMNTLQAISALITLLPFAIGERTQWVAVPLSGWINATVLAVICSALCYYLYGDALHNLSPLASAIFINIIPLTTIIAGVIFLKESFTWLKLLGSIAIIVGIFCVTVESKRVKVRSANLQSERNSRKREVVTKRREHI